MFYWSKTLHVAGLKDTPSFKATVKSWLVKRSKVNAHEPHFGTQTISKAVLDILTLTSNSDFETGPIYRDFVF